MKSTAQGSSLRPGAEFLQAVDEGSTWGSTSAMRCLTPETLPQIEEFFKAYSRNEKLQCLLSFFHAQPTHLARPKVAEHMGGIIEQATVESDEWVRALGKLLEGFHATGEIRCRQIDSEFAYRLAKIVQWKGEPHRSLPFPLFAQILGTPDRPPPAAAMDPQDASRPAFRRSARRVASVLQELEERASEVASLVNVDGDDEFLGAGGPSKSGTSASSRSSVGAAAKAKPLPELVEYPAAARTAGSAERARAAVPAAARTAGPAERARAAVPVPALPPARAGMALTSPLVSEGSEGGTERVQPDTPRRGDEASSQEIGPKASDTQSPMGADLRWDIDGLEAAERAATGRVEGGETPAPPISPFTEASDREASDRMSPFTEASGSTPGLHLTPASHGGVQQHGDDDDDRSESDLPSISLGSSDDETDDEELDEHGAGSSQGLASAAKRPRREEGPPP